MNLKDMIVPLAMAFLITACFNYFFRDSFAPDPSKNVQTGRSFKAPRIQHEHKPLNTEIDFYDVKSSRKEVLTEIETNFAIMTFSSNGAILQKLEFQRRIDGDVEIIPTIEPTDREQSTFLLALEEKTPFYYALADKKEVENKTLLTYTATTDYASVTKTFTIYKNLPKIDLKISITPKTEQGSQARLFIAQPSVKDISKTDIIQGITNKEGSLNAITKIQKTFDMTRMYWVMPNLFGLEDRYFVHAMIQDPKRFTNRAYFVNINDVASAILEGPTVTEETSWDLSFYMGPKEADIFAFVDNRLDQTLDYGWFTPICKMLMGILQWLYQYVHNYGWAIVLLTIFIKLLLMPFTMRGEKSMMEGQKKQREMQRKIQLIRQKYKDNPELRAKEETELIRKHGVPGIGGCLPMLVQFPIFIGLARVFSNSILLYKAPFLWITDLSARDPYFILPLLVAIGMILTSSARVTTGQQRVTGMAFGLMMGAFTASVSAGLALYIAVNMLVTVAQTSLIKKLS